MNQIIRTLKEVINVLTILIKRLENWLTKYLIKMLIKTIIELLANVLL